MKFVRTKTSSVVEQIKRIQTEIYSSVIILFVIATGLHKLLPQAIQLIILKSLLISLGLIHAHAFGKIAFPKVDWNKDSIFRAKVAVRVGLYIAIPLAYALGG